MKRELPIGVPVALRAEAQSGRSGGQSGINSQTTPVVNLGSSSQRSPYITTRRLALLEAGLSSRDRSVLETLGIVRLATTKHLERLDFTDVSTRQARATLASLTRRQLVSRLPRAVGGLRAGSAGYVYGLGLAGQRLIGSSRRPQRPWQVGTPFLAHTLAITELYVRLVEAGCAGVIQLARFRTEPACWRWFTGAGGERVALKPDAAVITRLGRYEDSWLVEVDLSTESTTRLARKADLYRAYWLSGQEQARHEVFPRVLWLVPDMARYNTLIDVLGRQPAEVWPLFTVAVFEEAISRIAQGAHV
jgi:Replication-relaxation